MILLSGRSGGCGAETQSVAVPLPCTYSLAPAILEAAQPAETMSIAPSSSFLAVFCLISAVFSLAFW